MKAAICLKLTIATVAQLLISCTDGNREMLKKRDAIDTFKYVPSPPASPNKHENKSSPAVSTEVPAKQKSDVPIGQSGISPVSAEHKRQLDTFKYKPSDRVLKQMSKNRE